MTTFLFGNVNNGSDGKAGTILHILLKALTGQRTEPGISTRGNFKFLCPNCIVFDHLICTIKILPNDSTSLRYKNFLFWYCNESGTKLDFLAKRKKANRNRHHNTISAGSEKSKKVCIDIRISGVIALACLTK